MRIKVATVQRWESVHTHARHSRIMSNLYLINAICRLQPFSAIQSGTTLAHRQRCYTLRRNKDVQ